MEHSRIRSEFSTRMGRSHRMILRLGSGAIYRMLIATALSEGVPIVTGDVAFRKYSGLNVVA